MSRLFESFEFLNRGWDVRISENQSLRSVFLWTIVGTFILGACIGLTAYQFFYLHRVNWSTIVQLAIVGFLTYRYARMIYQRLGH